MKYLKPSVHRLTLAQAITRLAYVKFFTSAVLNRWLRRHGGRPQDAIRRFPVAMKRNLDQAGKDTIEFILAGVSAFGKPYRVGRDNTDADEERIPHDFLRSGVYTEPLNDKILIDILLDKHSGALLRGYNFVELDREEFFEALKRIQADADQAEADQIATPNVLYDEDPAGTDEAAAPIEGGAGTGYKKKEKPTDAEIADFIKTLKLHAPFSRKFVRAAWKNAFPKAPKSGGDEIYPGLDKALKAKGGRPKKPAKKPAKLRRKTQRTRGRTT